MEELTRHSEPATAASRFEIPLRSKINGLVMLGVAAGLLLGIIAERYGSQIWPIIGGLLLAMAILAWAVHEWFAAPIGRLVQSAELLVRTRRPEELRTLPVHRHDELGQLARAIEQLGLGAIRSHHEASRLRRTLDDRIEQATQRATHKLQQLALRDPLTNLGNRRFLKEQVSPLYELVRDTDETMTCLLIDIDDFKQINDQLGHKTGDEIILLLAHLLRASVRADDMAVRMGGDEFSLWLPGISIKRAEALAASLAKLFSQQMRAMNLNGLTPGLSMGLATTAHDQAPTADDLLNMADQRLYEAKQRGKGGFVSIEPIESLADTR